MYYSQGLQSGDGWLLERADNRTRVLKGALRAGQRMRGRAGGGRGRKQREQRSSTGRGRKGQREEEEEQDDDDGPLKKRRQTRQNRCLHSADRSADG